MARTPTEQEWLTRGAAAAHEAGHVVVGQRAGLNVTGARIGSRSGGRTHVADTADDHAVLVCLYAGEQAQLRWLLAQGVEASAARRGSARCARSDHSEARRIARTTGLSTGRARAEARRHVNRHWAAINRTATRLAKTGRI